MGGGDGGDDCEEEGKLAEDWKGFCEELEEDGEDENGETSASLSLHSMAVDGDQKKRVVVVVVSEKTKAKRRVEQLL